MNVNIKEKELLEREVLIEIQQSEIDKETNLKVDELLKSVTIKGFRKGHIKKDTILLKFGKNIHNEVINKIINNHFTEILTKNKINLANYPDINIQQNKDITLVTIVFEILPNINLNLNDMNVTEYISDINEEDLLKEKNKLSVLHGIWHEVHTKVIKNDIVTLDIYENNNNKIKYLYKDIDIFLNGKDYIFHGFEDKLLNLEKNNPYEIILNEESIIDNKFLNKKNITIIINKIIRSNNLLNNEELLRKITNNKDTIINNADNELMLIIKEKLEKTSKDLSNNIIKKQVINSLLRNNIFNVPKSLINEENEKNTKNNINISESDMEKNIRLKLLFNEIKNKFNINVLKSDIEKMFNVLYKDSKDILNKEYILKKIENDIYEEEIMQLIISKINVKKERIDYNKLIYMDY